MTSEPANDNEEKTALEMQVKIITADSVASQNLQASQSVITLNEVAHGMEDSPDAIENHSQ